MCGIAGFVTSRREASQAELLSMVRAMSDSMPHRGPDAEGAWADAERGAAFGFRRLSVIDITPAGHQPMISASGQSVMIFNGEIYNAESLRPLLHTTGINFRGHSDTEILLEHAEAYGFEATLAKLVGMFAIAWFDRRDGSLWLARDRMGEKPLYFGRFGKNVLFASELRCFRAHPDFRADINPAGLSAYVRFGYLPHPHSIYRNVEMLAPGAFARIDRNGTVAVRRYYEIENVAIRAKSTPFHGTDEQAVDALEGVLMEAVKGNMVADVPLGAFLSGGVDSSAVVALMQRQSARPVKTFSIGFDVPGFDEAPHARAVAEHLKTEHHELYFTAKDVTDLVPRLPDIWDEPFADSSQLPTYLVSHMARAHVTVALSGDGGDEIFSGYSRYAHINGLAGATASSAGLAAGMAALTHGIVTHPMSKPLLGLLPGMLRARAERWSARLAQLRGVNGLERAYRGLVGHWAPETVLLDPHEEEAPCWRGAFAQDFPGASERAQIIDTLTYLPGDILTKVDRASMAVSLEARAPLLDHRVAELAWSFPEHLKRRNGEGKWALKQMLYRYVPKALIDRPKMGFGVPIDVFLRGPLRDWAENLLDEKRLASEGIFHPAPIRDMWRRHLAGETWQYPLWVILSFQAWRERWHT